MTTCPICNKPIFRWDMPLTMTLNTGTSTTIATVNGDLPPYPYCLGHISGTFLVWTVAEPSQYPQRQSVPQAFSDAFEENELCP